MQLTTLQEAASPLVPLTRLGDVRLFDVQVKHKAFPNESTAVAHGDLNLSVACNYSGHTPGEGSSVTYLLTLRTSLFEVDDEGGTGLELATCEMTYGALYQIADEAGKAAQEAIEAFGNTVATLTMWPYIRASIGNSLREMNYPSVVLPMLTQQDLVDGLHEPTEDLS